MGLGLGQSVFTSVEVYILLGLELGLDNSTIIKIKSCDSKDIETTSYYPITRHNSVVRVVNSSRNLPVSD